LKLIEGVVGRQALVEYQPARNFDAPKIILDSSLAKQELAWQPEVVLESGLLQTWQWMQSILV
jgi:UDP-glucose 4-epimerase